MSKFEYLREARVKLNLTLDEVSEGICSPSLLSLIERGKRNAGTKLVAALEERVKEGIAEVVRTEFSVEFLLFQAAVQLGKIEEARAAAARLTDNSERRLASAKLNEDAANFAAAEPELEALIRQNSMSGHIVATAAAALVRISAASGNLYSGIYWAEEALRILTAKGMEASSYAYEIRATLSGIYLNVGDLQKASALVQQKDREYQSDWDRIVELWSGALVKFDLGNFEAAASSAREASVLASEIGRKRSTATLVSTAIYCEVKAGAVDVDRARKDLHSALSFFEEAELVPELSSVLNTMASVELAGGENALAKDFARRSIATMPKFRAIEYARSLVNNADVLVKAGSEAEVQPLLVEALAVLNDTPASRQVASVWASLGALHETLGDGTSALICYKAASEYAGLVQHDEVNASAKK